MVLISRSIPTLLRGISQSSDSIKQSDHAVEQLNCDSDPVKGLVKRSGTQHISTLINNEVSIGDALVHTINRDETERYVVIFTSTTIRVFDLDGTERTVNNLSNSSGYLLCDSPRLQLKATTVADFTFVVNTNIRTGMDTSQRSLPDSNITQAIVFVNQVSDNTEYGITVDGVTVTDNTTNDTTLSTTQVATDLKTGLEAGLATIVNGVTVLDFTIAQNGPVLHIKKTDGTDFAIDGTDTQGNTQLTVIKNSVQRFTDLPTVSPPGYVVEVKGDESTNFDNYYVKFVTNNGGTQMEEGQWEECVKPGIDFKFNYDTMPHVLIRQADGNFRFSQVNGNNYLVPTNTGTYAQAGNLVTITINNHGLQTNDKVELTFTTAPNAQSAGFQPTDGIAQGAGIKYTVFVPNAGNNANFFTINRTEHNSVPLSSPTVSDSGSASIAFQQTLPVWGERNVGDENSAPKPSFIGHKINNIFFFRNRLGFLANDNVILSSVSKFFQFFPETVLTVIDSDPIDVAASHTKVAILKNAINMGEQLILFSDQSQFILSSSSDSLTPKTANILVATEFDSSDIATPVGAGNSIYYLTTKGEFSAVREYLVLGGQQKIRDAADITVHVPKLIPSDIYKIAISTSEDTLVLLGASESDKLYINKWLYGSNNEKILNSWYVYTFDEGRSIKNIDFIGSELFIVSEDDVYSGSTSRVYLEKLPFQTDVKEPNCDYEYHLDRKITESTTGVSITYDASTNLSEVTCPYRLDTQIKLVSRHLAPSVRATYNSTNANNVVTITKTSHGFNTGDEVEITLADQTIFTFETTPGNIDTSFIESSSFRLLKDKFIITKVNDDTLTFQTTTNLGTINSSSNTKGLEPLCTIKETSSFVPGLVGNNTNGDDKRDVSPGEVFDMDFSTGFLVGSNNKFKVAGDIRRTKFIMGENYLMIYEFAKQRYTETEKGGSEQLGGRLQLKDFYLKFENTANILVAVSVDDLTELSNTTPTRIYRFNSLIGSPKTTLGSIKLQKGTFKVPVMSRADKVRISIFGFEYLPTNITSAEYEANFYIRSQRT